MPRGGGAAKEKSGLGGAVRGGRMAGMEEDAKLAVFVYGSLVPGGSYWGRYCEGKVVAKERARVRGRIYQGRDGYLALAIDGDGLRWIRGWRLILRDETCLQNFDRLEGFDAARPAEQNDYQRVRTACFADDKAAAPAPLGEAWVYIMTPAQFTRAGALEIFSIPQT